jgi:hypothetical protein
MNEHDTERLKKTLLENGESPAEAESLAQMSQFLRKLPAPVANKAREADVLASLLNELPRRPTLWERLRDSYPVLLLVSQVRVIHVEIWAASALMLVLGTVITLLQPMGAGTLPLVAIAPLVAAGGVALLYDGSVALMLELEDATRSSARLLLLARLTLIFGFDLILALIGSIVLALAHAELSLVPLILSWFAPMAFLSGLAFLLSVLLADTLASAMFSLALWVTHLLFKNWENLPVWLAVLKLPGFAAPEMRPMLLATSVLLVVVALWWVGAHDRKVEEVQ